MTQKRSKAASNVPFAAVHLSKLDGNVGVSIPDAMVVADISRSTLYRLVGRGDLVMRRIGVRRSVITAGSLRKLMRGAG